jgi:tRNA(Ile)-lysidine synthase TilS/MesJ
MNIVPKLTTFIPNPCYLALSGGSDSIGGQTFLTNFKKKDIQPVFFDHDTETSKKALDFLLSNGYTPLVGKISQIKGKGESWEEYWRNERYKFFSSLNKPVITCHHLDDAIETWVFAWINGGERMIFPVNGNILRPFLFFPKQLLIDICERTGKKWIEDETNLDLSHPRNRIRHVILPEIKKINPGIEKLVRKKYIEKFQLNLRQSSPI